MGSIAGMTMSDIAGKVQKSDGSDSARPTLDKINFKNRRHAPAKSARPFNVECAPSMSGPRETVWARAGLKIRDCRHWRGGAYKYLVLIAIHSQIFSYTFPISTTCLRLILSRVVRFKSLIARSSHVAFECPRFPTHSIPLPLVLASTSRAVLLRPTGVQAVSLGPFALYFDRDRRRQGHLSCKFTATTAEKRVPIDFSRGKCARSCSSSCCGSKREKIFLF